MNFLKKNWSNLIFIVFIVLLFIPQTSLPIKVFVNRLISFSPSEVNKEKRTTLSNYDWNFQTLEGVNTNLSVSEGKVTLINFWATWCPPCVAEMPALQNLYDQFGERVDFYFISSEEPEVIKKFLDKRGYKIPVFIETSKPPTLLEVQSLPTTFLITQNGEIAIRETGAAKWDSEKVVNMINELLSN
tara:strand:- start:67 stop:627 length:561 start_codon:yes stop_codon:yes gene_type:complete